MFCLGKISGSIDDDLRHLPEGCSNDKRGEEKEKGRETGRKRDPQKKRRHADTNKKNDKDGCRTGIVEYPLPTGESVVIHRAHGKKEYENQKAQ
jgi:hypothetical protein